MARERSAGGTACAFLVAGAVVASLGGAPTAEAQDPVRVYVMAVPTSDELEPVAARVGAAARAALRELEDVEWAAPDQTFLGYSDFTVERLRRARTRLDEGRQAYLDLELGDAIEKLRGAVEDFDAAATALEDPQDLGEALLFLGASQVFDGRSRDARRTFARLHVQMPYLDPDPNTFNPDVIAEYERSQPRDARNPSGSITIESEPPGAIAYVDYVARGRTPITVRNLADGTHVVRVTRPGATPFVQEVEIRRGRGDQVNAFLEDNEATAGLADAVGEVRSHDLERMEEGDSLARIAVALEVERLGVIQVSEGAHDEQVELRFVMFEITTGGHAPALVGPVPTGFGELEGGVRRLVGQGLEVALAPETPTSEGERIPPRGGGTEFTQVGPVRSTPVYEQWWFWTIIGVVVVAGAAVAIGVAASSSGQGLGSEPGGQVILQF